jgi:hypothetical protein
MFKITAGLTAAAGMYVAWNEQQMVQTEIEHEFKLLADKLAQKVQSLEEENRQLKERLNKQEETDRLLQAFADGVTSGSTPD